MEQSTSSKKCYHEIVLTKAIIHNRLQRFFQCSSILIELSCLKTKQINIDTIYIYIGNLTTLY